MDLYQHISSSHNNNFPIIAFAIIGILATAFLLVGYYLFVIKSCHFIDFLPCFLYSRRRNDVYPVMLYSVAVENRGLDESVIRAIPIFQFKKPSPLSDNVDQDFKGQQGRFCCECSVCLNEFQENENLRIIPNCGHVFHIDCIDIWLQNNRNCPLCRASVSSSSTNANQLIIPSTPIHERNPSTGHNDAGFVVIELQGEDSVQERLNSSRRQNRSFSRKLLLWEKSSVPNKRVSKMGHVSSMGDECIDIRRLDDGFTIEQPIRRSFSMDSSYDRQLCLGIQEMLKQNTRMHDSHRVREVSPVLESCSSSSSRRVRRSFFSFGSGRGSRNANLPVHFEI